ncbi:sorting nexin-14-like isoform X7 [Salvelinus alpinus]|uniref:sorting nexin-14-like isoform X7 n=1 Tax=Salvelinus alpinus TaxID=8036 RepID=UPI0039FDB239
MERIRVYLENLKQGLQIDVLREVGRQYPVFCFLLVFMFSSTILLNRYLHILMVFWSFLAGVITFYCSLGTESLLPNILFTMKPKNKQQEQQELFPLGHSCAVCGKVKCKRHSVLHRPTLLLENYQPWLDLKVYSKVDASMSELLELVLENFVYPWYRDITDDEACVDELRMTFRFFASVLVRRAQKVDVPSLISGKMMKAAMKHIEIIAKAKQKVKNTEGLQQAALDEYGPDLHVALRSRREELLYLRKVTEMLFAYLMPPKATDCRSLALLMREVMVGSVFLPTLDFMADPDTVNHMVLIFVDDSPPELAMDPPSALVPFLQKYADPRTKKTSVLKLELKEIREQQDLLFRFMNFLKQEGAVQVLQFCLTVEEFNDKILCPELSDSELQRLHGEVQHLYETYCLEESIDKISFDPVIIEEIRNIAQGPYEGVVKLQTMHCLFEAYEHVLSLLESVFTPMFCHSDEYFRHLLRGVESPKMDSRMNRNSLSLDDMRNISKRGESFGISRIGSKIKGVFKSTTMEGTMLPYAMVNAEDEVIEEATMVVEDNTPVEACSTSGVLRNLSAWSITIPYVDEVNRERVPVFCIEVERNDRKEERRVQNEPWVSQATGVCKKVVSIFSYGWKKQKALTSTQDKLSLPLHKLITESPSVSRLQMMERVLVQEKAVTQVLATDKKHVTLHPPGKTARSLNPSRQHLQDFTGFLECYLFNLYLTKSVKNKFLFYNDGLPRPNPPLPRTTLGQLCAAMGLPILHGIEPRSVVTPLALRCSALDRCATQEQMSCQERHT